MYTRPDKYEHVGRILDFIVYNLGFIVCNPVVVVCNTARGVANKTKVVNRKLKVAAEARLFCASTEASGFYLHRPWCFLVLSCLDGGARICWASNNFLCLDGASTEARVFGIDDSSWICWCLDCGSSFFCLDGGSLFFVPRRSIDGCFEFLQVVVL